MRKAFVISVILTLAVAFGAMTASAPDSSVTLSAPTSGNITFSGHNGSPIMTITGPLTAMSGTGALARATSFTVSRRTNRIHERAIQAITLARAL